MKVSRPFELRNPTTRHFFRAYNKPKNFYEIYGYDNMTSFKNNKERYNICFNSIISLILIILS